MKKTAWVAALGGALVTISHFSAHAQGLMISGIASDPVAKEAFGKMVKGRALPKWVPERTTSSPAQKVVFDGQEFYVMSGCNPHDCDSEQIAIMYNVKQKSMYGLFAQVDEKTATEKLTWLNMGGENESIDGKTILFAALTGSLANHPTAFNYKSP